LLYLRRIGEQLGRIEHKLDEVIRGLLTLSHVVPKQRPALVNCPSRKWRHLPTG
jgi:hypothetical protein